MQGKCAILFVCMGNICRSPTAEGVFRRRVHAAGLADCIEVDSAGTHGYHIGAAPDARSVQHAARRGVDLSALRARQVCAGDFARFDRVLAMDDANLALLETLCPPEHRHKLGLFMQFSRRCELTVVPNPYYGAGPDFELVLDYVEDAADGLLAALRG